MKYGKRAIGLLVTAWAVAQPSPASAQVGSAPSASQGPSMPTGAMMANPYLNPYMNPYLNPAMTQGPMNANNALLYMYAAQAANGGIGSGRISTARMQSPQQPKAALAGTSASTPGGGAARFFNPGPVNVNGAGRYYNRSSRYFMNNGR